MTTERTCRLCSTPNLNQYLGIFSAGAMELKMLDILCEHFKCDISEDDPFPNYVCLTCWSTTEAFHILYQKLKAVHGEFQNQIVKTECDPIETWPTEHKEILSENNVIIEPDVATSEMKIEPDSDESGSEDETPTNCEEHSNEANSNEENSNEENGNEESGDESLNADNEDEVEYASDEEPPRGVKALEQWRSSKRKKEFRKIFEENKHAFDLTCDCCSSTFQSLEESRSHYSSVHNNPNGYIKCCGKMLQYRYQVLYHIKLKKHIKRNQTDVPTPAPTPKTHVQCDICKKFFNSKNSLESHMKYHIKTTASAEDSKFMDEFFDMTCDQCDAVFTSYNDARSHYREFHNESRGYVKCCKVKLKEMWLIRDHIKSHLNPESFKCDICSKTFSCNMILVTHKRRHYLTMNKPFICDYCGHGCRDKETIIRHMFTKHIDTEPKYECDICHKKFRLPMLLKNHQYAQHREKKPTVTCEICGKTYFNNNHLGRHMLSHADKSERMAQRKKCEHCGEWMGSNSAIYYHNQLHNGQIQKCTQCDEELPNRIALQTHMRRYHREFKHKCKFCGKAFEIRSKLAKHEEGHTRHKIYTCAYCSKTFTVRSSLNTHLRRNHRSEEKERLMQLKFERNR